MYTKLIQKLSVHVEFPLDPIKIPLCCFCGLAPPNRGNTTNSIFAVPFKEIFHFEAEVVEKISDYDRSDPGCRIMGGCLSESCSNNDL